MSNGMPGFSDFETVVEGGVAVARQHAERLKEMPPEVRTKADKSPVTAADLAVAAYLEKGLLALTPGANWLCEEGSAIDKQSDLVWIVDPLDGTKEFLRGLPEFSVSVALLHRLQPVLAAVVNPMTGEAGYWSAADGLRFKGPSVPGAFTGVKRLEDVCANASRTEFEKGSLSAYRAVLKEVRPIGSVAYKLLRVAMGLEELYFSVEPKSEWDLCGGVALVTAAGLAYETFDRVPMKFTGTNRRIETGAVAGPAPMVRDFMARFSGPIADDQDKIARKIVR
ncbi:MAG: hypothetical protein LCH95_22085 [Proteobacteria bacterium]|nr:hypothetical protein [Pseudomonadota bacterium]